MTHPMHGSGGGSENCLHRGAHKPNDPGEMSVVDPRSPQGSTYLLPDEVQFALSRLRVATTEIDPKSKEFNSGSRLEDGLLPIHEEIQALKQISCQSDVSQEGVHVLSHEQDVVNNPFDPQACRYTTNGRSSLVKHQGAKERPKGRYVKL